MSHAKILVTRWPGPSGNPPDFGLFLKHNPLSGLQDLNCCSGLSPVVSYSGCFVIIFPSGPPTPIRACSSHSLLARARVIFLKQNLVISFIPLLKNSSKVSHPFQNEIMHSKDHWCFNFILPNYLLSLPPCCFLTPLKFLTHSPRGLCTGGYSSVCKALHPQPLVPIFTCVSPHQ